MGSLIDTSVLIEAERGGLDLEKFLSAFPDEDWMVSSVTVSELLHRGLRTAVPANRARRLKFAEETIHRFPVLAFDLLAPMRGSGRNLHAVVGWWGSAIC
jgi:predicted nucleic acid-binding protein